ncbi:MAG: DUF2478 domain-containing protein [Pseudolabrys sp.]|nr:DUF2478 domain-containing protein [Pseudolabrys sp.]MDP2296248.1 DUF2478 domain-containing protein [Pseudolabrys sp.]
MATLGSVRIAAIVYPSGFQIDDFLTGIAYRLRADRVGLGGVLQENAPGAAGLCAAMTVVDLASQISFPISQDLGSQARGCRLDARGLAEIGSVLDRTPIDELELFILNKFGKAEAEGGGLRPAFAKAIETGIPVLTAVRAPYTEAWLKFHGRLAVDLPPDLDVVLAWCRESVRALRTARRDELTHTG